MTTLLVVGEPLTGEALTREPIRSWLAALTRLGVTTPGEAVEAGDLSTLDGPGRVVVVVREQLDHLNALYCRAVLDLETFKGFGVFVNEAVASGRHDLGAVLGPLFDGNDRVVVAVPYSRLAVDERRVGPVLLTATRLLHKRLVRMGLMNKHETPDLLARVGELRRRADEQAWDDTDYWGWSTDHANDVAARFAPGNNQFARRAWDGAWVDLPVERDATKLDLASQRPEVVSDVMTTIQRLFDGLLGDGAEGGSHGRVRPHPRRGAEDGDDVHPARSAFQP